MCFLNLAVRFFKDYGSIYIIDSWSVTMKKFCKSLMCLLCGALAVVACVGCANPAAVDTTGADEMNIKCEDNTGEAVLLSQKDTVYVNPVSAETKNDTAEQEVCLTFHSMTRDELFAYFDIPVALESCEVPLDLQKISNPYGITSTAYGSVFESYTIMYADESRVTTASLTVSKQTDFERSEKDKTVSVISGISVEISGWQTDGIQAYTCRFVKEDVDFTVRTTNLSIDQMVSLAKEWIECIFEM